MNRKTRRVVAVDGGPRKNWSTAALLARALDGAADRGVETRLVRLHDLSYKGCVSCFACKTVKNWRDGRCWQRDELQPVLELLADSTAVIMGSPIYLGDVTGAMRSFWERYLFSCMAYDWQNLTLLERGPAVGLFYTMNVPQDAVTSMGYDILFKTHEFIFKRLNSPAFERLTCCDTLQFDDYSRYHAPMFDEIHKKKVRAEHFPLDLQKAYEIGAKFAIID
ncbi:MAG: flavodoxin family protein [Deltaproteobacteria bacterium]|jgi:multimeric flavodoxin WrbA|nr:flavodoxin family protein [Deltaproteobacteria bacterium]